MERLDVAIVGGGIAGLTCAMGLRARGLRVALFERDAILGGRASSWTDERTGDPVHIGPHILLSEYPNFLKLLDELGTRDRIVWQDDGTFITRFTGADRVTVQMADLPAPFHFLPAMARDPSVSIRAKLSAIPIGLWALQMTERDFLALDAVNARAFLRSTGVSDELLDQAWEFTSMAIMNVPLELCSAGALLRFYARFMGHSGYRVGFPDGGLGDIYVPQARAALEASGVAVHTGAAVRGLIERDGRITGLTLADGTEVAARVVVAALPPHDLQRAVPQAWARAHATFGDLAAFRPCPYVCVYLWFDRKLTDLRFWARSHHPADLNCDFYDYANILRGWAGRGSFIQSNIIYSHRAAHLSDDEIVRATVDELAEALPEARRATLLHARVHRVPMAIHCPLPGTERKRPPTRSPVPGLLLAGDWIRTELPSSMESAAASGWIAAEEALADLGQKEKLAVAHKQTEGLAGVLRRAAGVLPLHRLALAARGL